MNAEEAENLIVRLSGDATGYVNALNHAEHATGEAVKGIEGSLNGAGRFFSQLRKHAGDVFGTIAAFQAKHFLEGAIEQYSEAESNLVRLSATMKVNGREVEKTTAGYEKFSEALAEITTLSNDAAMALFTKAETFGLTGDAAARAAKNAVALSAAITGTSQHADEYFRFAQAIETGNVAMLRRLPGLRGVKNESEIAAKAMKLLKVGFEVAKSETETYAGATKNLAKNWEELQQDFGKIITGILKPIVKFGADAVNYMRSLSETTKTAILIFLGIVPAVLAFQSLWSTLKTIIAIMNPWTAIVMGVAAAVAYLVGKFGGFAAVWKVIQAKADETFEYLKEKFGQAVDWAKPFYEAAVDWIGKTWEYIKASGAAAWEWIKNAAAAAWAFIGPVVLAGVGFVLQLWDTLKQAGAGVWDLIVFGAKWAYDQVAAIWADIGPTVVAVTNYIKEVVWKSLVAIRNFFRDSFIFAEFIVKNLGDTFKLVFFAAGYQAVKFGNVVAYVFGDVIWGWLVWFKDNWKDVFTTALDFAGTVVTNLVNNIVTVIKNIPGLIKGTVKFDDLWTPLTQGFVNTIKELPKINDRVEGELEKKLREEAEGLADKLTQGYDAHYAKRLEEIESHFKTNAGNVAAEPAKQLKKAEEKSKNVANELGFRMGSKLKDGFKAGADKFDALDVGSAEALTRKAEYLYQLSRGPDNPSTGSGSSSKETETKNAQAAAVSSAESLQKVNDQMNTLVGLTKDVRDKPVATFEGAGLA